MLLSCILLSFLTSFGSVLPSSFLSYLLISIHASSFPLLVYHIFSLSPFSVPPLPFFFPTSSFPSLPLSNLSLLLLSQIKTCFFLCLLIFHLFFVYLPFLLCFLLFFLVSSTTPLLPLVPYRPPSVTLFPFLPPYFFLYSTSSFLFYLHLLLSFPPLTLLPPPIAPCSLPPPSSSSEAAPHFPPPSLLSLQSSPSDLSSGAADSSLGMDRLAQPPLVSTEISEQVRFHIDLLLLCPPTPRFEGSSPPSPAHPEDHRLG